MRALGDRELHGDQIDPGHLLGHGVLHLDSRIDLEEHELGVGDQEFDGRQSAIPDMGAQPGRREVEVSPQCLRKSLRGSDFEELLMPALHTAIAVSQRQRPAARGDDLHFDVPGVLEQQLGEHRGVTETELRLRAALPIRVVDLLDRSHHPHATPAAPGQRLDHDRAGVRTEEPVNLLGGGRSLGGGQDGHARGHGGRTSRGLVTEQVEHRGIGPDERDAIGRAGTGECGVLAEESVAGMDVVGAGFLGGGQDRGVVEVGRGAGARQRDRLARRVHIGVVGIVVGVDRHGVDAEFGSRADDAQGDLAAIGDQQFHWMSSDSVAAGSTIPLVKPISRSAMAM